MQFTYDRTLDVGSQVELILVGVLIDQAKVIVRGPNEITLLTNKNDKRMTFLWDEDVSRWKRPFKDTEGRVCIRKESPGYIIRPI